MTVSLQEELDRSFGDGPGHPPVEQAVAAGRRALRRRRVGAAVGALAVVAVLGTAYAVTSPGPHEHATGEVMVDPTTTPEPEPADAWEDDIPVRYVDGDVEVRPGVVVHEHIENPYGYDPPRRSDAFDLTVDGQRTWLIAETSRNGFGMSSSAPSNGWASFADWVAGQVGTAAPGEDGWPATLRLAGDGSVVAAEGAEVLQRTDDPRLGGSFAEPGTPTGAALVRPAGEEQAYFVVWRVVDARLDVITTPPADVVGATFAELLDYARAQYASGEGLR